MSYGMVAPFDAGQRFQWRVGIPSQEDLSLYAVLSGWADEYTRHTSPAPVLVQCSRQQDSAPAHARRLLPARRQGSVPSPKAPSANRKLRKNESPDWPSGFFIIRLTSLPPGRRIRPSFLQTRSGFRSLVCTSHRRFVPARFSMIRGFSSSIPTSALVTFAPGSCEVAASKSM
jgi:hypothetical protein